MSENNSSTETNKYLFINLITMLSITAMQQLGKLVNPAVGKANVNLEAAQATIDTLDMLFAKTGGNLDKDEARLLKDTLATLKMNYVETRDEEERKKPARNASHSDAGGAQSGKGTEAQRDGEKSEQKPSTEPGKDPKFHKSYRE